MTFLPFAIVAAAWLSGLVVIATWDFRTSTAPLAVKLTLPAFLLVASLDLPWRFAAMLGRPVPIAAADLPNGATLVAFQMFDGDTRADLWLREAGGMRAYEIVVGDEERSALRKAKAGQARGEGLTVQTGGRGQTSGAYATGSGRFSVSVTPKEPAKSGE